MASFEASNSEDPEDTVDVIFALDFDGVLVDSASETGYSGWRAAKILWPKDTESWHAEFTSKGPSNETVLKKMIDRFVKVRPCLETGWEAPLILRLLADPEMGAPSVDDIVANFQSTYKPNMLSDLNLTKEECNKALKQAREDWMSSRNGQDWIDAHSFFEGACSAVRALLKHKGNNNVFVITTKAKDFAVRLLEQQKLYALSGEDKIRDEQIYGLGSGPKATVLQHILETREGERGCVGVIVEDNVCTLQKIHGSPELQGRILPVLASWGYNTKEQREQSREAGFLVLDRDDPSSISTALQEDSVRGILKRYNNMTFKDIS